MTPDDYLLAAWLRGAPNADTSRGFPRGFWPDVARTAVEMALGLPLSHQTRSGPGNAYEEGRAVAPAARQTIKGLDVSKLEFKL